MPMPFLQDAVFAGWLGTIVFALALVLPFALVIRYGVISREEAYLERKFGDVYRRYRGYGAGSS
jgi:protein-S-isoprenylcysteine O-methyltransferase Ste14